MEFTFTAEELQKFASDLGEWHAKKTETILTSFCRNTDGGFRERPEVTLERIVRQFDEANPKPKWSDLL